MKRENIKTYKNSRTKIISGRFSQSNPDLFKLSESFEIFPQQLVQTKSDSDVAKLFKNLIQNNTRQFCNSNSEIYLKTISVHNTNGILSGSKQVPLNQIKRLINKKANKMSTTGARSHHELSQSSYDAAESLHGASCNFENSTLNNRRRMSENSLSGYSQRSFATNNSANANSPSHSSEYDARSGYSDNNSIVRVPIIGYEVMEERARFTVYKLRVENPFTNDYWLVLRRYTDFVRLNTKLKQAFPTITLHLPRKKLFGDNFNSVFLDNRVRGLQSFVNSIMVNEELRKFKIVRDFFCLDEPPSYSESMEECRAIFEAQEETISHLKMQINNKNDLILSLQQKLRDEMAEKEELREAIKYVNEMFKLHIGKCSTIIIPPSENDD